MGTITLEADLNSSSTILEFRTGHSKAAISTHIDTSVRLFNRTIVNFNKEFPSIGLRLALHHYQNTSIACTSFPYVVAILHVNILHCTFGRMVAPNLDVFGVVDLQCKALGLTLRLVRQRSVVDRDFRILEIRVVGINGHIMQHLCRSVCATGKTAHDGCVFFAIHHSCALDNGGVQISCVLDIPALVNVSNQGRLVILFRSLVINVNSHRRERISIHPIWIHRNYSLLRPADAAQAQRHDQRQNGC